MNESHLSGSTRPIAPPGTMSHGPMPVSPGPRPIAPAPRPLAPGGPKPVEEPISIVDDLSDASVAIAQFRATINQQSTEKTYKRPTTSSGTGACRVRSFHGRLSDDGMQRFDDRVNEWLDAHPQIEVKFATTTIGTWDGKTKEPAIVVNIWY